MTNQQKLLVLIIFLFIFRLVFGLFSDFWFSDELQIYLIGLKSYTTQTWPYYGPDVVYTNTQIPGALQGLLVSVPFYIGKIPESPIIFLNILSFASLTLLASYIAKRIKDVPDWLIWTVVMTSPWTMHYSTQVANPSYALVFAIPFFVALIDRLPIYSTTFFSPKVAFFLLGSCTTLIMQLHMSWVILIPLAGLAFLFNIYAPYKEQIWGISLYLFGLVIGAITLFPTFFIPQDHSVASNITLNLDNWSNLPIIALRFFSFASQEIPYVLGGNTDERLAVIYDQLWLIPVVIFLLIVGFLQVAVYALLLFKSKLSSEFKKIKLLVIAIIILLYFSFFFSIKGPSSHTFYIMLPVAVFYSFYCYQWLIAKSRYALMLLKIMVVCGVLFHIGLGAYNFKYHSLYTNRAKVDNALKQMDYTILGQRRADVWGYGY
jgi:hypothetical protein